MEWINEVIYNSKTEKYDPGYTIKATLASQTTPEEPKPTENVFPLKYGDTSAVKGSYIKEFMIYLAKTLEAVWNILKLQMVMRVMEKLWTKNYSFGEIISESKRCRS